MSDYFWLNGLKLMNKSSQRERLFEWVDKKKNVIELEPMGNFILLKISELENLLERKEIGFIKKRDRLNEEIQEAHSKEFFRKIKEGKAKEKMPCTNHARKKMPFWRK